METLTVRGDDPAPEAVARAVELLRGGHLLIYPTDTLYALGGCALDPAPVHKVRLAKGRDQAKPLPLIAADADQVRALCRVFPPSAERLAARFWPGPLTLVLPAAAAVPGEVTAGTGTVAIRIPALALARALCAAAGPLVSTSANPAGGPLPVTCQEAVAGVGPSAALALDAGPGQALGSTILDLSVAPPRLLRAGPVSWHDIEAVSLSRAP